LLSSGSSFIKYSRSEHSLPGYSAQCSPACWVLWGLGSPPSYYPISDQTRKEQLLLFQHSVAPSIQVKTNSSSLSLGSIDSKSFLRFFSPDTLLSLWSIQNSRLLALFLKYSKLNYSDTILHLNYAKKEKTFQK